MVVQSCPSLWDPMDCSTPGFPVHQQLLESVQTQCPLSRWSHPTISSFAIPFCSCPQSIPASGSFPMIQLFAWAGQRTGASASALPMNIQSWFPWGLTGLISLLSMRLSRIFSSTTFWKNQFFGAQPFLMVQLSHLYMTTGQTSRFD